MKVIIRENGYWCVGETDTVRIHLPNISFKEFDIELYYPRHKDFEFEWGGNNPFKQSEKIVYTPENLSSSVQIQWQSHEEMFDVYKNFELNRLETTEEILIEIAIINKLFKAVLEVVREAEENLKKL